MALCLLGIPALAFVDAYRAGVAVHARIASMPPAVPTLPPARASLALRGAAIQGTATRVQNALRAPVSGQKSLVYRLDIRAGQDADLIARCTQGVEFMLTCGDGTQIVITGVVELDAFEYGARSPCQTVRLNLSGVDLLPVLFTEGGWACEVAIHDGDAVEAHGPMSEEVRVNPLGSTYRTPGIISILHGVPGRPVVVRLLRAPG
jgi:hypothetical protein